MSECNFEIKQKVYALKYRKPPYVAKRIAAEMKKYAYKESDILQIVHLIDTDGAFIPDNLVKARTEKGVQYFEDHIETGKVKYIQERNQKKSMESDDVAVAGTYFSVAHSIKLET